MTSKKTIRKRLTITGIAVVLLGSILLFALSSCQVSYLTQAIAGHLRIMRSRQPIEKVLKSNQTDDRTKAKLRLVLDVRAFAIKELGLPDNKSYTLFAKIDGDYPGWNVYCAPRLSVMPVTWCYPVAGCVVYHGYFKKEKAMAFATKMKEEGLDVYVSPFTGYSTLGWYNDPILSTNLRDDSVDLAGLIIHELAHQEFYQSGDSRYSEGFAVTVERAGVLRWLGSLGRNDQMAQAEASWKASDQWIDCMLAARNTLDSVYHLQKDTADLLRQKDSVLYRLEQTLGIKNRRLNNAYLVPISTYHSQVSYFQNMLDSCQGDFRQFYQVVRKKVRKP